MFPHLYYALTQATDAQSAAFMKFESAVVQAVSYRFHALDLVYVYPTLWRLEAANVHLSAIISEAEDYLHELNNRLTQQLNKEKDRLQVLRTRLETYRASLLPPSSTRLDGEAARPRDAEETCYLGSQMGVGALTEENGVNEPREEQEPSTTSGLSPESLADEQIFTLRNAHYSYIEAVEAVLVKCYAVSNHGVERNDLSWDLALENLKDAHERFRSVFEEASEFHVQIRKPPPMQQSKAVAPNNAKLASLSLNDALLRDQSVPLVKDQIDSKDILDNNHGDQVDMSEEDLMVLLQASEDLDVFMAELEEILEHDHDLSDLDPKNERWN